MAIRKETVVRKLTELREAHDLTQERAAAKVGVTVRQWQRWESGESVPYPRNIGAIADRFDISAAEFFDPPESAPEPNGDDAPSIASDLAGILADINQQLAEQTRVLEQIKQGQASIKALIRENEQAARDAEKARREFLAAVDAANRALLTGAPLTAAKPAPPTT